MKLAVSIINYCTPDLTIAAAKSVLEDLGTRDARVAIIDNASNDGSDEVLSDWITDQGDGRLTLVRSTVNGGFSAGHNQGFAAAPASDFYLILNSDAVLRAGFFEVILAAAKSHPEAGLIAPGLEDEDSSPQTSCFRFARPATELIRGAATGPVTRILRHYMLALSSPPRPDEIEWASFACILLRGDMLCAIGPMDEGYFLYFEDAEYCLRARRAGWSIAYVPDARVVHFRGGSGPVKSMIAARKRLPAYYWRSRTRFFRQAYGRLGPLRANLAWIAGRSIAQSRRLTGRHVPKARDGEWLDIWTGILDPLRPGRRG